MQHLIVTVAMAALMLSPLSATWAGEMQKGEFFKASKLIGTDIENRDGEDLGDVEDLLVDSNGIIHFALVETAAFFGGDYVPVPWSALKMHKDGYYILPISEDRLEQAPRFDEDNWGKLNDPTYAMAVYNFYGVTPPEHTSSHVASESQQLQFGKTVRGEVLEVDDDLLVVRDQRGREITLHVDQRTDFSRPIIEGDRVEAKVSKNRHARSIRTLD